MHAASWDHTETVKLLAPHEKGMKDNNGRTALFIAKYYKRRTIIDILSKYPEERCFGCSVRHKLISNHLFLMTVPYKFMYYYSILLYCLKHQ